MTKPNQHEEGSPATDDIRLFATALINPTWSFLIYCSFQPFSVLSHTIFISVSTIPFTYSHLCSIFFFHSFFYMDFSFLMKYYLKIFKFNVKPCTLSFMGDVDLHSKEAGTYLWVIKKVK